MTGDAEARDGASMLGRWTSTMGRLWRGLSTHWIGTAGVVLTTSSFAAFIIAEALRILGFVTNAYVGLISYLTLPALFVLGLALIPLGWWRYRRRTGKSTRELLAERFDEQLIAPSRGGSRFVRWVLVLTLVNVLFLGAGSARMLRFMDQPEFCGTACHSVMSPEWTTYQDSPHAHVPCVDCHVGEGAEAAFDAKLNGLWQMISVTFDLYERPIPTPVHNLRPARETCEKCHWPERFYGDRVKTLVHYGEDRRSTPRYTTLALKVGSGSGERRGEIHWHVAGKNEVRYLPADRERSRIRWVEVRQPDGSYKRYDNRRVAAQAATKGAAAGTPEVRVLDCVDCHNRATHIYEDPVDAVDRMIREGEIDRSVPYVRRRALEALTGSWATAAPDDDRVEQVAADSLESVDRDFRAHYRDELPAAFQDHYQAIDEAVAAMKGAYGRNIHERMRVTWNAYPNHLGHRHGGGCRRCHSPDMVDAEGNPVKNECTLCHSILAYESAEPFRFLQHPDPADREAKLHAYLRDEFVNRTWARDALPQDLPAPRPDAPAPPLSSGAEGAGGATAVAATGGAGAAGASASDSGRP